MTWPWWRRQAGVVLPEVSVEAMEAAGEAVKQSARDLGRVEQRTEQIDALAMRSEVVRDALARERDLNEFNRRIRNTLAKGGRRS